MAAGRARAQPRRRERRRDRHRRAHGRRRPGKPVGTVWFAWAVRGGAIQARSFRFKGDRDAVRAAERWPWRCRGSSTCCRLTEGA